MPSPPSLLRAVLAAERKISGPVNRAANSPEAADVLLGLASGARFAFRSVERLRAGVVHAFYLPSRRDLQVLETKVERLQRAVDEWAADEREGRTRG